ncbi:MAG: hypothetical protein IKN59_01700 [Paludibacteraceae bacterium]|nr:hypothetical protein [Paludibacteraceae bacterium]
MTTKEQLLEIRASLPNNRKYPAHWSTSKKVLLYRALKKESIADYTDGELDVFNEWLEHVKAMKKENKEFEKSIQKIVQQ